MATVTVCSFECFESGADNSASKRRKVKKALIAFMGNCVQVEGTDEVVDEKRLDEDGFLIA